MMLRKRLEKLESRVIILEDWKKVQQCSHCYCRPWFGRWSANIEYKKCCICQNVLIGKFKK